MLNQGTKAIVHNAWVIIKIHALLSSKNNVVLLRVLGIVQKQYKDRIKSLHLNSTIDQK
jgi:hypothetical protein